MPKKVDPRQRRTLIADALMRVAAERGPEAVSLRHVAAAAGVTTGMVQHYFATKDELMLFALEVIAERIQARMSAEPDLADSPSAMLRSLLTHLLPLDENRRVEGLVGLAAVSYAASHPAVAEVLCRSNLGLRQYVGQRLRALSDGGELPVRIRPEPTATALVALVDGLGQQVLTGAYSPQDALAAFDAQLALIFDRD